MEIQIKVKSGLSFVEKCKIPNSIMEVEVAHSSIEGIITKIKSSIDNELRIKLAEIFNEEANYNKEFVISYQTLVSDKQ